jgi:hypothetical protein
MMKKCTQCGLEKSLEEFYEVKGMKDGHKNQCKECMKINHRKWHHETYIPHKRQPTQFCPKGHDKNVAGRDHDGRCMVCRDADSRAHYLKNKERRKEQTKAWRKKNPEKVAASQKRSKERHKESIKLRRRIRYIKVVRNLMCAPEKRYKFAVRMAKKRNLSFILSFEEFKKLIILPCYYCGVSLQREAGGGLDRINNDISIGYTLSNVVPCCGRCNKARGTFFTSEEFKVMVTALLEYRKSKSL